MEQQSYTALIIDEAEWALMCALDPHFRELSFKENEGSYLVINVDVEDEKQVRWMIVPPDTFENHFDHIKNAAPIKTYEFIKKD